MAENAPVQMQDPDVAVLKAQLGHMAEQMGGMREAVGMLNAKFDIVTGLLQEQARLQEQYRSNSDGIVRAHLRVDELRTTVESAVADRDAWRASHAKEHAEIDRAVNTWRGWVMGIGAVGMLLVGLAGWVANGIVTKLDSVAEDTHSNEVELLKHKLEEARKGN